MSVVRDFVKPSSLTFVCRTEIYVVYIANTVLLNPFIQISRGYPISKRWYKRDIEVYTTPWYSNNE